jgi:hypothetical protein
MLFREIIPVYTDKTFDTKCIVADCSRWFIYFPLGFKGLSDIHMAI